MTAYYTLTTSLPRHDRQFKVKQTPISRIQLEKRLNLLPGNEKQFVYDIENLLWNSWFNPSASIDQTLLLARKLLSQQHAFTNELIHWFFDLRSILTAMRLRNMKQALPKNTKEYWLTRWNARLINSWNLPDFGLRNVYPWLLEADKQLTNNRPDALEEILLTQIWKHLNRIEDRHYFDLEAVIIYIIRWNLVNYWSQFDEAAGIKRLNEIADTIIRSNEIISHV